MRPTDIVALTPLMELSEGSPDVTIALVDGPVALGHPALAPARIDELGSSAACGSTTHAACVHGTFVAGLLAARRDSEVPGVCPACRLLVRPIFGELDGPMPRAEPKELARAIVECVDAGALVINLSVAVLIADTNGARELDLALAHAVSRQVLLVAAAGNRGEIAATCLTRHPWVIPVAAFGAEGRVAPYSDIGRSIGLSGVGAPGHEIRSLSATGGILSMSGTSVSAPFVTGTIALLASLVPHAPRARIRAELRERCRSSIVPPLLNAAAVYRRLLARM